MTVILQASRPKHWIKNLLVFALPFSDGLLFGSNPSADSWLHGIVFFVCLSLVSSSNYLLNDLFDKSKDKLHPVKSNRPIASGSLSASLAYGVAAIYLFASLAIALFSEGILGGLIVFGFASAQFTYSTILKHLTGFDIIGLSSLYLLRACIPYAYEQIKLSQWFLLMVFSVSLFLSSSKRYAETLQDNGVKTRPVLGLYSQIQLLIWVGVSISLLLTSLFIWSFNYIGQSNFILILLGNLIMMTLLIRLTGIALSPKGEDPTNLILCDKGNIILMFSVGFLYLLSKGFL